MEDIFKLLLSNPLSRAVLDAIPAGVVVVDEEARTYALNNVVKQTFGRNENTILGKGAGHAFGCLNALNSNDGCGTIGNCEDCEIRAAVRKAVSSGDTCKSVAQLQLKTNNGIKPVAISLTAVPVSHQNRNYVVLVINELSDTVSHQFVPDDIQEFQGMIGGSRPMKEVFREIREFAKTNASIYIHGESGTGKELAAMAIHNESRRSENHFVPFNCGALPEGLVESELFGHVKGAFTGALYDKKGRFELAHGGTLFLDEVGELKPDVQIKLLRVLQEGVVERVGAERRIYVDVRIISATNRNLEDDVRKGKFREDLYYRLCVIPITIPPMRQRENDIELLIRHFHKKYAGEFGLTDSGMSEEVSDILLGYDWPGNIRELQNVLQYSVVKSRGKSIDVKHLPPALQWRRFPGKGKTSATKNLSEELILKTLKKVDGNKREAAKRLGVSRSTLYRFMNNFK